MAKIIIPFGSGCFDVKNYSLHKLSQSEIIDFFSHGSVMGFAFEHMLASEYSNVTGVRTLNQKKDLVIEDPIDKRLSQHWEAKGFRSSQSDLSGKTRIDASTIKVSIGASSEVGTGRKANMQSSLAKYEHLHGFIFHIPGTFPVIYHYQLPIDVVLHHRHFGKEICLATLLAELRHLGVRPMVPKRIRNVPLNLNQPYHKGRLSFEAQLPNLPVAA